HGLAPHPKRCCYAGGMTFDSFVGGFLLALAPLLLVVFLVKGVTVGRGIVFTRRDRPALFWTFTILYVGLFAGLGLLFMNDSRFTAGFALLALCVLSFGSALAERRYGTAGEGSKTWMVLFLVL